MNEYLGKIWTPNNQLLTRVKMLKVMSINDIVSKLNFVEQRVWLSVVGIVSVAMGKNRKKSLSWPICYELPIPSPSQYRKICFYIDARNR